MKNEVLREILLINVSINEIVIIFLVEKKEENNRPSVISSDFFFYQSSMYDLIRNIINDISILICLVDI